MNAFKRLRNGQLPATYSIKFEYKGQQILRKTPYTNKTEAEAYGRALRIAMEKEDCAGVKAAIAQAAYSQPHRFATIGQICEGYRRHAGHTREISNPATIESNIHALRNILARARDLDPSNLSSSDKSALDALSAGALDADLIDTFKASVFNRAQEEEQNKAQSMFRTANSLLRQARSIFAGDLLDTYQRKEKLNLPDLAAFLKKSGFNKVQKSEYHAADDTLIAKTFAAIADLEQTDRNAFIAIWLAIGFGLRRGEIAKVGPDSFIVLDSRPTLRLLKKTKNGEIIITIPCQLDAWTRLAPHTTPAAAQTYLLTGHDTERTEETFRRISSWMRNLGWGTQKTIHEFRAWAGCQIALADPRGLLAARDFLRHASIQTTERYYGRYIRQKIAHVPLQIPTIATPTALPTAAQG